MNKKNDTERKTKVVKFRVNKHEYEKLKRATAESGLSSMSEYALNKIIATPMIDVSDDDLHSIRQTLKNVSERINTIAIRLNKKGEIYPNDIADMKDGMNEIISGFADFQKVLDSLAVTPQTFRAVVDKAHREAKSKI